MVVRISSCLLLALVVVIPRPASAVPYQTACDMPWWQTSWNVVAYAPTGQSFISPGRPLQSIVLGMAEGESFSSGVTLRLEIRVGDIQGTSVGASLPVFLADGVFDDVQFDFDPPLLLEPDALYVFEFVRTSEEGYAMVRGGADYCPDVHAWIGGQPATAADLIFHATWGEPVATDVESWSVLKASY